MADHKAQVTLTSLNAPSIIPSKRVLNLDPTQRTIPVGRASKSVSKGLVASTDNAWFDSPVMSRNHAEILLHSDNKTLQLQDVGSMHGTILNDQELQPREPRSLSNGDVVKFGAEVRRGSETFPACSFKIEYQLDPYMAAKSDVTRVAPESSEIDLTNSDDEDVVKITSSSPESTRESSSSHSSISKQLSPLETVAGFSGPKGLTEDQVVEDLTNMKKSAPASAHAGNAQDPLVVDSEDDHDSDEEKDEDMSDVSEDPSDSDDSVRIVPICNFMSESDSESDAGERSEDDDEDDEKKARGFSSNEGIEVSHIRSTRLFTESGSEAGSSHATGNYSGVSDDEVIGMLTDSESNDSEDNDSVEYNDSVESVMGDAGVSYQISVVESGSDAESTADLSSDDDSEPDVVIKLSGVSKYDIMAEALASENEKEPVSTGTNSLPIKPNWSATTYVGISTGSPAPQSEGISGNEARTSFGREPSPSDAAMVKDDKTVAKAIGITMDIENSERRNPSSPAGPKGFSRDSLSSQQNSFAQIMGEKTGKADFFQAREENKGKLELNVDTMLSEMMSSAPGCSPVERPKWVPRSIQPPPAIARPALPTIARPALPTFVTSTAHPANETRQETSQQQQRQCLKIQQAQQQAMLVQRRAQHFQALQNAQTEQQARRHQQQAQQQQRAVEQMMNTQQRHFNNNYEVPRAKDILTPIQNPIVARTRAAIQRDTVDPRSLSQHHIQHPNPFSRALSNFSDHEMSYQLSHHERDVLEEEFHKRVALEEEFHKSVQKSPEKAPARSSVPISNLVNGDDYPMPGLEKILSKPVPQQNNKRKADAISDLRVEEVAVEESRAPLPDATKSTEAPLNVTSGESTSVSAQSSTAPPATPEEPVVHRVKRLKRVAEKVGYAALGGVLGGAAVGAGLFAALVITAPEFM